MKKIVTMVLATVLLMTAAVGCGTKKVENPAPKDILDKITAENSIQMGMDMGEEEAKTIYNLNLDDVEDYAIKGTMVNVAVDNIAVVIAKEGKVDSVKESLEARKSQLEKNFEQYLVDKYEIAKNGKVFSIGNYVFLVIHENADNIEKQIKELVK